METSKKKRKNISRMLDNNSINSLLDNTDKLMDKIDRGSPLLDSPISRQFYEDLNCSTPRGTPTKEQDSSINFAPSLSRSSNDVYSCSEPESTGLSQETPSMQSFLRMPKAKEVDRNIYKACEFILGLDISLNSLNLEYLGHCPPSSKEQRKSLREKFGAKFGHYEDSEVAELNLMFYSLLDKIGVPKSEAFNFCSSLQTCITEKEDEEKHKKKWRKAGVRLIIGLYLGQELPRRLAISNYNQLLQSILLRTATPVPVKDEIPTPSNTPVVTVETPSPKRRKRKLASTGELNGMMKGIPDNSQESMSLRATTKNPHVSVSTPKQKVPRAKLCPRRRYTPKKDITAMLNARRKDSKYNPLVIDIFSEDDEEPDQIIEEDVDDPNQVQTPARKRSRRSIVGYERLCSEDSFKEIVDITEQTVDSTIESVDQSDDKESTIRGTTIFKIYRMPRKTDVPPDVYEACEFIKSLEVKVSPLNKEYTNRCDVRSKDRKQALREKFGANFKKHTDMQDCLILKRFAMLKKNNIVSDLRSFCETLMELTTVSGRGWLPGKDKEFVVTDLRNIFGLFVGQDIPNMIAYAHFDRLLTLAIGYSPRMWKFCNTPQLEKEKNPKRWTLDEDIELLRNVIATQTEVKYIEDVEDVQVDWDWCAKAELFEGKRTAVHCLNHWKRVVYPALVEERTLEAMLEFRKEMLQEVIYQGAKLAKEIDWDKMEDKFFPKRKSGMLVTFNSMMFRSNSRQKVQSSKEFLRNINKNIEKIDDYLAIAEDHLEHIFKWNKRTAYKEALLDALDQFIESHTSGHQPYVKYELMSSDDEDDKDKVKKIVNEESAGSQDIEESSDEGEDVKDKVKKIVNEESAESQDIEESSDEEDVKDINEDIEESLDEDEELHSQVEVHDNEIKSEDDSDSDVDLDN